MDPSPRPRTAANAAAGRTALTFGLITAACAGGGSTVPGWTTTDSAGITIVTNRAPEWANGPAWRISDTPTLDMGGAETDSAHAFFGVRDVRLLPDGRIAVVNTSSNEVRFFDADGRYLGKIGRPGEGPGEFIALWDVVALDGDTLLAYDARLERFTWFDADGRPVRTTTRNEGGGHGDRVMHLMADGSLFVVSGPAYGINSPSGFFRPDFAAFRYPPDGSPPDSIGAWPGSETWVRVVDRSVSVHLPLFPHATYFAADTAAIWLGYNDNYQLERMTPDGHTAVVARVATEPVRVTEEMIRTARNQRLETIADRDFRRRMRGYFDEMPVPETLPAFNAVVTDDFGYAWVRRYALDGGDTPAGSEDGEISPVLFDVLRPDGRWLGTIPVPGGFYPFQIGRDFLLGVYKDDLGIEHVQRWAIENRTDPAGQ